MESKRAVRLVVCNLGVAVTLLSGCVGFHPMNSGVLATPGCTISAEDNSFTIRSGQEFQPPFQIKIGSQVLNALPDPFDGFCSDAPSDRVKEYSEALSSGAERVRVTVPGVAKPLYGVLALLQIADKGDGAATHSYQIEIPQDYVDAASGGKVSVVYEFYDLTGRNVPSWVLWLSDQPL